MNLTLSLNHEQWRQYKRSEDETTRAARLHFQERLAAYEPRHTSEDPVKLEMAISPDDPAILPLLQSMQDVARRAKLLPSISVSLDVGELGRARWAPLLFYSSVADTDSNDASINRFPHVLCEGCRFPDVSRPPDPYLIRKAPAKSVEIFGTRDGLIVVRPRVLEVLRAAVGEQIEVGDVRVGRRGGGQAKSDDALYWVRPVHLIGDVVPKALTKPCPACGRPLESRAGGGRPIDFADGFHPCLAHFGTAPSADIALVDGYYGTIGPNGTPTWYWSIAVSGSLFAHLKAQRVRSIATAPGDDPPRCYFSARGEPPLEPAQRKFELPKGLSGSDATQAERLDEGRKAVESLKDVPWDHAADGCVYLYLTSPEIMAVDPMTFDGAEAGPFRVQRFKPGLHRFPVSAIKGVGEGAKTRGVPVDSASLLFVDAAFYEDLLEAFNWDESNATRPGESEWAYYDRVARQIGNRFGFCSASDNADHDFQGDGEYVLDVKAVERVS